MLVARTVYGEALPVADAIAVNLRGSVWRVYDGAGLATAVAYDFDDNAIEQSRQLVADSTTTVDWAALAGLSTPADLDAATVAVLEGEVFTTTATFNAFGLAVTQTTPDLSITSQTYNDAFLLATVGVNHRGTVAATPIITHIDYDPQRRHASIGHGNGTETSYTYDPLTFRLTRLRTTRPASGGGTENVQDLRYFYDAVGNITDTRDDAQQTVFFNNAVIGPHQAYEYEALYRLVVASGREHVSLGQPANTEHPVGPLPNPNDPQALRTYVERYDYDNVGNILQVRHEAVGGSWTRRYDYAADGNRLLATSAPGDGPGVHSAVYAYNSHGSMSAMPHLAAVDWDHAEQMRHADLGGGGDVWFVYDSAGQRVRKVQVNAAGSTRTERIYLGGYEVYREHVSGTLETERQTLHVADGSGRVCMLETLTVDDGVEVVGAANTSRYQYGNHLGSVGLELDGSGLLISYEEFHPYGSTAYRAANSAIEVSASRYRYTGQGRDEETGLGHHGVRYYAAWLGRWTAADPIGLGDGVNRFAYVGGNPTRLTDPSGTQAMSPPLSEEDHARLSDMSLEAWGIKGDKPKPKSKPRPAQQEPDRSGDGPIAAESQASKDGRARMKAQAEAKALRDYEAGRYVEAVVREGMDTGTKWLAVASAPLAGMALISELGIAGVWALAKAALEADAAASGLPLTVAAVGGGVGLADDAAGLVDDAVGLFDDAVGLGDDVPAAVQPLRSNGCGVSTWKSSWIRYPNRKECLL